jgi:hypothetical protein
VVGIDVADQAVSYAQRVGLHWAGSSENLEIEDPSATLDGLHHRTHLRPRAQACKRRGWLLGRGFALRWIFYERISEVLGRYGQATQ